MNERDLARYYAGGRLGIGLLIFLFPGRILQGMLGGPRAVTPGVKLIGRMLGARDAIVGAGTLGAIQETAFGGTEVVPAASIRPWMSYGAACDAADVIALALAYRHLPKRKRFVILAMALAGTATGGYLYTLFED